MSNNVNGFPVADGHRKDDESCDVQMLCESCGEVYDFRYWYRKGRDVSYNNMKDDTVCPNCGAHDGIEYI